LEEINSGSGKTSGVLPKVVAKYLELRGGLGLKKENQKRVQGKYSVERLWANCNRFVGNDQSDDTERNGKIAKGGSGDFRVPLAGVKRGPEGSSRQ